MLSTFKKTPGDSFHTGDIVNLKDLSECKILKQDGRHVRVEVVESKKITWVPVTDILPDSGDDRLLPADPLEGHELGGIPLDMLSRPDLSPHPPYHGMVPQAPPRETAFLRFF